MDEISHWWASTLQSFVNWVQEGWHTLAYGVLEGWDIRYFVFAMAGILILGLYSIWRRGA